MLAKLIKVERGGGVMLSIHILSLKMPWNQTLTSTLWHSPFSNSALPATPDSSSLPSFSPCTWTSYLLPFWPSSLSSFHSFSRDHGPQNPYLVYQGSWAALISQKTGPAASEWVWRHHYQFQQRISDAEKRLCEPSQELLLQAYFFCEHMTSVYHRVTGSYTFVDCSYSSC